MNKLNAVKRKIGILVNKTFARNLLEKINLVLFHWDERMHTIKKESIDGGKKYMIIRPFARTQGLLSTYWYVLKNIRWACENGYTPYVDFESDICQYHVDREINGTYNAWEYYFEQPFPISKEEIMNGSQILLSGWSIRSKFYIKPIPKTLDAVQSQEIRKLSSRYARINKDVLESANNKYKELFSGKTLGVFLRGTDYVKLKPKGHARQPEISDVITKIDEFIRIYPIDSIFVVTEDYDIFSSLKKRYGEIVFSSDDYFVRNFDSKDYVEAYFENDAYERGKNYLIRILLLNRCDYLISGITNGSLVARCLKIDEYEDAYWFDLGNY